MTLTLDHMVPQAAPLLARATPARLVRASDALWRVLDAKGIVIGHLLAIPSDGGIRYRARRYHTPTRRFREVGDFWSADDAVNCLRLAR